MPIFSNLSKAQRLRLVGEVMIGVLCEEEPLPPNTIQHNATFRRKDVGEFHVNPGNEFGNAEVAKGLNTMGKLFYGGPVSPEQRASINRPVNEDERKTLSMEDTL